MDGFDDAVEPVVMSLNGRKRRSNPGSSKREVAKRERHSGQGHTPHVSCEHNISWCVAATLGTDDAVSCCDKLYSTSDKTKQDAVLLSYMDISVAKRVRTPDERRQKTRKVIPKYFLLTQDKVKKPVCKETFMSVFGVTKDRLSRIARFWMENGTPRPVLRGGHRAHPEREKSKEQIRDHVTSFTCRASHYGRRGAPGRKYLPNDLNMTKMHRLFLEQNQAQVSFSLYYSVFRYDFNLGFGSPSKDVCSTYFQFRMKMKDPELSDAEKQTATALHLLHRHRGRRFYDLLNEVEDTLTVCFDVMENLVLPKTSIGQAYYSRQLYLYVFGIVRHQGPTKGQSKLDIDLYVWREDQNRKDSNMISSALWDYFTTVIHETLDNCDKLRLFSDSCYGQNKNINTLSMLFALVKQNQPQMDVDYFFPIRGHSFLPADRVFGRIEQEIRCHDTIVLPEQYVNILKNHGRVHTYGEDWSSRDFKTEVKRFVKPTRTFKLSEARVLGIQGDKLGFRPQYSGEFCYHSVLKKGKTWVGFNPPPLPMQHTVSIAKKNDVQSLQNEMGVSQDVHAFYDECLHSATDDSVKDDDSY